MFCGNNNFYSNKLNVLFEEKLLKCSDTLARDHTRINVKSISKSEGVFMQRSIQSLRLQKALYT